MAKRMTPVEAPEIDVQELGVDCDECHGLGKQECEIGWAPCWLCDGSGRDVIFVIGWYGDGASWL